MINDKPLEVLAKEVAAQYPALKDVRVNPALARGWHLLERFAAAVEAAGDTRRIELLLHGTPEANVDSVLTTPLRACPHENARWFSNCVAIAQQYARGAQRQVIFAVLNPTAQPYGGYGVYNRSTIYTSAEEAHHLPLFVARW